MLDVIEGRPGLSFVPGEEAMKHRRLVIVLSITTIAVLGLDVVPANVPFLNIDLDQSQKHYFVGAIAIALLYQFAMYVVHWNRDLTLHDLRMLLCEHACLRPIERQIEDAFGAGALPTTEEAMFWEAQQRIWRLSSFPWFYRLHAWLMRWPPALLFATALAMLLHIYLPGPIFWTVILFLFAWNIIEWLMRRRRESLAGRARAVAARPNEAHPGDDVQP
jgi:hypothetical protein